MDVPIFLLFQSKKNTVEKKSPQEIIELKQKVTENLAEFCDSHELFPVFCETNQDLDSFFKYFSAKCYEFGLNLRSNNSKTNNAFEFDKSQLKNCRFSRRSQYFEIYKSTTLKSEGTPKNVDKNIKSDYAVLKEIQTKNNTY